MGLPTRGARDFPGRTIWRYREATKDLEISDGNVGFRQNEGLLDAFGRLRTSEPFGVFVHKNIHNRNLTIMEEIWVGQILEHGAVTAGPFVIGEIVTGGTSGAVGTITAVNAGDIVITVKKKRIGDFEASEVITGGTSGASATTSTVGTGTEITYLPNESSVQLQIGTADGDRAVRQSTRYLPYVPGKSQLVIMTGSFGTGKTNLIQRIGYNDDDNGLFFELNETTLNVVLRSKTSGSVVDTAVPQSSWNIDKLDGSGASAITLDETKEQIFIVDFQWLGAGTVRFGFSINGKIIYCHQIDNANILSTVYMSTATLPVRYEIVNDGVTASLSTMKETCTSVTSEGGFALPGLEFSKSRGIVTRAVTARAPIFAIRLKAALGTKPNRKTVKLVDVGVLTLTNDAHIEVAHLHHPSAITATWADISGGSGVEFSTDITAITGNPEHVVDEEYVAAGSGNRAGVTVIPLEFINEHSFLSQNPDSDNSQVYVIYATALTGTADVLAHATWIEFD